MKSEYHYNVELPENVTSILQQDFWLFENVNEMMLRSLMSEPLKFSSSTSIYIKKGHCKASINLLEYDIEAPCVVNVRSGSILHPTFVSPDFDAAFIVLSNNLSSAIYELLRDTSLQAIVIWRPVMKIPEDDLDAFDKLYSAFRRIVNDKANPYSTQTVKYTILSFFYGVGYRCYQSMINRYPSLQGRVVDDFITLAQQNFRKERFLDFYAKKLELTPKHLSRTVKKHTGYTAVEWIERLVILEAKAMLKSSNLNIQQIADELNFPSQSFFGKYFKKFVGMSPKEFRNS